MKIEEAKRINEVTEKMLLEQKEMSARHEKTTLEKTQRFDEDRSNLSSKLEQFSSENAALHEAKANLEAETRERVAKIDTLTYELERAQNELRDLRDTNKGLDSTKHSQEKSITEYVIKFESLERQLADKSQYLEKQDSEIQR